MTHTSESEVNIALARVLKEAIAGDTDKKYKDWEVEPEQRVGLKRELDENEAEIKIAKGTTQKPDIVVKPAVPGLELIIETKFDGAGDVEAAAQQRLRQELELYPGKPAIRVKQVIALFLDESLKQPMSENMLESSLRGRSNSFLMCLFQRDRMFPRLLEDSDSWIKISLPDLARIIKKITVSETATMQLSLKIHMQDFPQVSR